METPSLLPFLIPKARENAANTAPTLTRNQVIGLARSGLLSRAEGGGGGRGRLGGCLYAIRIGLRSFINKRGSK